MFLTSILLLPSISAVLVNFEQILERQYEPVSIAQSTIDAIYEGVMQRNSTKIHQQLVRFFFYFEDNEGWHYGEKYFINDFLFKLNTSIPPKILDIQNLNPPRTQTQSKYAVNAAVQWGGKYMTFKFERKDNRYPLKFVRLVEEQPHILNKLYNDFANETVTQMMKNQVKFVRDFYYQTCEGRPIFDSYAVIVRKLPKFPVLLEVIHYYVDDQHLVQFRVGGGETENGHTHLFEVDFDTGKVLKGLEDTCDDQFAQG